MVDRVYIVKSTPLRAFIGYFQHLEDILQTYWRWTWKSLMQKKYFLTNLQGFYLSHFFNTLKICCRHVEDVHEEIWCRKNIFWLTVCWGYQVSCTYCQVSFPQKPLTWLKVNIIHWLSSKVTQIQNFRTSFARKWLGRLKPTFLEEAGIHRRLSMVVNIFKQILLWSLPYFTYSIYRQGVWILLVFAQIG